MKAPRMRVALPSAALVLLGGCGDWFGKDACKTGEQSCDGKQILTCTADLTTGQTKWQRFGSCGITGPNLVCALVDGLAECVPDLGMDGGVSAEAGATKAAQSGSGTAFAQSASATRAAAEQVEWARLDVQRANDGSGYVITEVSTAVLDFAPSAPGAGEVAAVSYAGSQLVDATLVAFDGKARATTAWLRAPGITRVALIASSGAVLAERVRAPSSPSAALVKVASVRQSLSVALPATLKVYEGGRDLGWLAGVDVPTRTVVPTEEQLRLVADALNRLTPLGASTVSHLAFTSDADSFTALVEHVTAAEESVETEDGRTIPVRVDDAPDGGVMAIQSPPYPASWFSNQARVSLSLVGQMLVVNVSDGMMVQYRADPSVLTLEIVRHVGALFVKLTSAHQSLWSPTLKFPKDFPAEVESLLRQRVTPLLLPMETFTAAWDQLHNVAVQAQLASPYLTLPGVPSDAQALEMGFAAAPGAQGAGADFAEFFARVHVPERWNPSPCPDIRGKPIEEVPVRRLVHLAKLETIWGLGYLSTENLKACVGDLTRADEGPGIRVHTTTPGEVLTFGADVLGTKASFLNDEVHVTVFGRRADDAGTQATMDAAYRGSAGLFRFVPAEKRSDPRLGAGFYLTNPKSDSRSQAAGGILLITRADDEQIEAHALMVYQGASFLGFDLETNVWPLITARYDIPEDQRDLASDTALDVDPNLDAD